MRKTAAPSAKAKIRSGKALAAIRAKSTKLATTNRKVFRTLPLTRNVGQYSTGFPKQMWMRHKYIQSFNLPAVMGALSTFQISCNGLFDPDNAGATTHQPLYFDQVAAIYNKYVVLGSKATVTFHPAVAGSTATTTLFGAYIEDDTTITPTTAVGLAEQPSALFRVISVGTAADQFDRSNTITLNWDAKKAFGGDVIDNNRLYADNASNPLEQQYFTYFAQDAAATPAATAAVNCTVIVEYSVMWFELLGRAES